MTKINVKEDDVIFCTVKKIEGTTVYLDIDGDGEGSMILSEVAAGRIRNLREYVSPGRKVVCKVLRISGGNIELSLRRVTAGEREEVLERHKKERALVSMLKVVKEDADKIIEKIKEEYDLLEFLDAASEGPKILEKFLSKENAKKVFEILSERITKEKSVERRVVIKTVSESGVKDIQEILDVDAEIRYLGSSSFSIRISGREFKEVNGKIEEILEELEERAKEKKALFEVVK